jgi:NAD dependent epimerase/dehydratase family enzyme
VHLAGKYCGGKRSQQRKEAIITSREQSAQLIYGFVKKQSKKPEAFISASGVDIRLQWSSHLHRGSKSLQMILGLTCQNGRQLQPISKRWYSYC